MQTSSYKCTELETKERIVILHTKLALKIQQRKEVCIIIGKQANTHIHFYLLTFYIYTSIVAAGSNVY